MVNRAGNSPSNPIYNGQKIESTDTNKENAELNKTLNKAGNVFDGAIKSKGPEEGSKKPKKLENVEPLHLSGSSDLSETASYESTDETITPPSSPSTPKISSEIQKDYSKFTDKLLKNFNRINFTALPTVNKNDSVFSELKLERPTMNIQVSHLVMGLEPRLEVIKNELEGNGFEKSEMEDLTNLLALIDKQCADSHQLSHTGDYIKGGVFDKENDASPDALIKNILSRQLEIEDLIGKLGLDDVE